MSLGFVVCFGITEFVDDWKKKWFMAVKGPRGALFYMGSRFGSFCVYCWKNK